MNTEQIKQLTVVVDDDHRHVVDRLEVDAVSRETRERVLGVAVVRYDHRRLVLLVALFHSYHAQPVHSVHRARHLRRAAKQSS